MPKLGHNLKPKIMGCMQDLQAAHRAIQPEINRLAAERQEITDAIDFLYQEKLKLEWAIFNTELALGIRKPIREEPTEKHFWQGVVGRPHDGRSADAKSSKATEKAIQGITEDML